MTLKVTAVLADIIFLFGVFWIGSKTLDIDRIIDSWAGFPFLIVAIAFIGLGLIAIPMAIWPKAEYPVSIRVVADKHTHTYTQMVLVGKVMVPQTFTSYELTSADGMRLEVDQAEYLARSVGEKEAGPWR